MRLLILALTLSACAASPYDKARQSITAIEQTVTASAKAVDAFNFPRQHQLAVDAGKTCEPGPTAVPPLPVVGAKEECIAKRAQAAVDAFRAQVDIANKAIVSAEGALALAEAAINVAELAKAQGFDPAAIVAQLLPVIQPVLAALRVLGIAPAGLTSLVGGL